MYNKRIYNTIMCWEREEKVRSKHDIIVRDMYCKQNAQCMVI